MGRPGREGDGGRARAQLHRPRDCHTSMTRRNDHRHRSREDHMGYTRRTFLQVSAGGLSVLAAPAVHAQQALRVGLIPSEDSRAMLAASQQLLEMLEKNLGQKVQGFVASDYNGVIEALRAGHLEVAYLGPFSYVLGTTIAPIEAFATAETAKSGRTYYHSQIITRVDSGIKTVNDLKGRTFAF